MADDVTMSLRRGKMVMLDMGKQQGGGGCKSLSSS